MQGEGERGRVENQQPPPQQPQKCPRCDSLNTKFCYYNNYSLSQPRYFCKTCRRYWTQGGTLRNVPVGGGCRKGKRTKTSNSGENSLSTQPAPPPPPLIQQQHAPQTLATTQTLISTDSAIASASPALRNNEPSSNLAAAAASPSASSISPFYSGGGFLSSLAAIQSLNQPQAFSQNQPINVGGNFGGSNSNMALLQGFNLPTFSSQQQHDQQMQQSEFFQMGNRDKNVEPLYPNQESLIQPRTTSSHQDWRQSLVNSANPTPSSGGFWTVSSSSGNSNSNTVGSSMNPYQWPDLPGYGPPP